MKGKIRYYYALKFARAQMDDIVWEKVPITMTHPVVLHAASRFRLQAPQIRRLVSDLRKDRDGIA